MENDEVGNTVGKRSAVDTIGVIRYLRFLGHATDRPFAVRRPSRRPHYSGGELSSKTKANNWRKTKKKKTPPGAFYSVDCCKNYLEKIP